MSPFGAVFFHEGAESRVQWRQAVRTEVFATYVSDQVQRYPVLTRFVAVVGVAHESGRKSFRLWVRHCDRWIWFVDLSVGVHRSV